MPIDTRFRNIVVTSDLSDNSIQGLQRAAELATSADKLHIIHVVSSSELLLGREYGLGLEVSKQALKEIHAAADQKLASQWKAACPKDYTGPQPRLLTINGSPAPAICEFAESVKADLIVIGTHGRTGIAHALIGSVAENVVRHAPCAVLTVRIEKKKKK